MAVTDGDEPVVTSGLGSCVAVVIHDEEGRGGMLHAMLPEAPPDSDRDAKYVDTGIAALLDELTSMGTDPSDVTAKLAGGASMLKIGNGSPVGEKNVAATEAVLSDLGIDVVDRRTGGDAGRSVSYDPTTGDVTIRTVDSKEVTI
ncbi:Chemotaxis protein [Halanaeroarchaeum sp. HSR-CO]|nr:Chemotaxis protein [Halanaeroarchaeum sp. HSR-CO]